MQPDDSLADAYAEFLDEYPTFRETADIDALRDAEYGRLDAARHAYLDYTGAGLYAASQISRHAAWLTGQVLGNPHSGSPSSAESTRWVEGARRAVLRHFEAGGRYTAIFTANATAAIKLVAESFPFAEGGRLLLSADNHNSVNGIREYAAAGGAELDYAPLATPDLRLDLSALQSRLAQADATRPNLFAYPAQSNFSGVRHPLAVVADARRQGWRVLLDAAALVPTSSLDLRTCEPDFVTISFYKMFGYPTGVGCLLVRHDALPLLRRPWFAGGTVNFASVAGRAHILAPGEAGFEDGTLNFLGIPAVEIGLDHLAGVGLERVGRRVTALTGWTLKRLLSLRHANGRHMVRIYGPTTMTARGGTLAMNFYDPDGHLLDYRRVEELAGAEGISLRTGCFCNPGAGESAEGLTADDMAAAAADRAMTLPRFLQFVQHRSGKSAGAIRVSFGIASNFADAHRFFRFAAGLRDQAQLAVGKVSFDVDGCRVMRDGS